MLQVPSSLSDRALHYVHLFTIAPEAAYQLSPLSEGMGDLDPEGGSVDTDGWMGECDQWLDRWVEA